MKKSTLIYVAVFLAGVWLGPKVAPTLRRVPIVGGMF